MGGLVVDVAIDPLQVGIETHTDEAAPVVGRSDPLRALLRVHGRVAHDKHARAEFVAVAVELVDMGGAPRQSEIGGELPPLRRLVVGPQVVGEVTEGVMPSVAAARVVVTGGPRLLIVKAYAGLGIPCPEAVFLYGVGPQVIFGVVGDERHDARTLLILVAYVQIGSARLGVPPAVGEVPLQQVLKRGEVHTHGRNVRVVHTPDAVFLSVVALESRLPEEVAVSAGIEVDLADGRVVDDSVERVAYAAREGIYHDGPSEGDALLQQVFAAQLGAEHDTRLHVVHAVIALHTQVVELIAERGRKVVLAETRVVEQVVGRLPVAGVGVGALQPPCQPAVERHRALSLRHHRIALSVASVEGVDVAFGLCLPVGEGLLFHHDDATQGLRTVSHRLGTLHHLYRTAAVLVDFGCVVESPLLSGLSRTVVDNEDAVAVHAVDDGFGHRCPGLYGTHAAHVLKDGSQRFAHRPVNDGLGYPVAHAVDACLPALARHHDFADVLFLVEQEFALLFLFCGPRTVGRCRQRLVCVVFHRRLRGLGRHSKGRRQQTESHIYTRHICTSFHLENMNADMDFRTSTAACTRQVWTQSTPMPARGPQKRLLEVGNNREKVKSMERFSMPQQAESDCLRHQYGGRQSAK